jgi:purine-binding chemotaxis protein CheW
MQALLLPVGDELHALYLGLVREVVPMAPITPVPGSPSWLLGVVNLRGEILPVIDSARPLGIRDAGPRTHLTVADTSAGPAAVAVTGAPEPCTLGEPAGASEHAGACGRFVAGDRIATLLDLEALTEAL